MATVGPGSTEIQANLNRLAGTQNLDAQAAANVWAGTSGMDLLGALNYKLGTSGLGWNLVCELLRNQKPYYLDGQECLWADYNAGLSNNLPPVALGGYQANYTDLYT